MCSTSNHNRSNYWFGLKQTTKWRNFVYYEFFRSNLRIKKIKSTIEVTDVSFFLCLDTFFLTHQLNRILREMFFAKHIFVFWRILKGNSWCSRFRTWWFCISRLVLWFELQSAYLGTHRVSLDFPYLYTRYWSHIFWVNKWYICSCSCLMTTNCEVKALRGVQ